MTKNPSTPVVPTTPAKKGSITVIFRDTTTGENIPGYGHNKTTELEGTDFHYNSTKDLTDLVNKDYVQDADLPTIPTKYTKGDHTIVINVKHGTITVTPDKPGKPGEPINPNDPNGPKYPDGTDKTSLTRIGTQTVHYVGAGNQTPNDNVTSVEFGHSITYDCVTGKYIIDNGWTPSTQTYTKVNTPDIPG